VDADTALPSPAPTATTSEPAARRPLSLAARSAITTGFVLAAFLGLVGVVMSVTKQQSALNNLQGQFVSNQNVIAAAALIAAVPTLLVYVLLQKQFIAGLTLGSTKG